MLKLMFITNNVEIATIAQEAGVDRIFIDLEYIGKSERQKGMDTVQSFHSVADIKRIRPILHKSELLVRCNPIHQKSDEYCSSEEEIEQIIQSGADIIMLPFFKTINEVATFLKCVNKRVKTLLLFETKEAIELLDDILSLDGIDEYYIGLNDLSISYGKNFMFELLSDGMVDMIVKKMKTHNKPYGFGGIASLGNGMLPSEYILKEHYRLNSSMVILSRSFCNVKNVSSLDDVKQIFINGIKKIRQYELFCQTMTKKDFEKNKRDVRLIVDNIRKGCQ